MRYEYQSALIRIINIKAPLAASSYVSFPFFLSPLLHNDWKTIYFTSLDADKLLMGEET